MAPIASHKKVQAVSSIIFLLGLAILAFFSSWWPGIMLVLGLSIASRSFLKGKVYDAIITLIIFSGTFVVFSQDYDRHILLPILFFIGALHIFIREFLAYQDTSEIEKEEQLEADLEDDQEENADK